MALEKINIGTVAGDGNGEGMRDGFIKSNTSFDAIDANTAVTEQITVTLPVDLDQIDSDVTANNAKVGITPTQEASIINNNAKVGISISQSQDIGINNAKITYDPTSSAKVDGIEENATADQTGAEIKTALFAEADTNNFTDNDESKLDGIEALATIDQTGAEIKASLFAESDTNNFTDNDESKLDGIEALATIDQTGAEIKPILFAEDDTNNLTDYLLDVIATQKGMIFEMDELLRINHGFRSEFRRNFTKLSFAGSQYFTMPTVTLTGAFEIEVEFIWPVGGYPYVPLLGEVTSSSNSIDLDNDDELIDIIIDGSYSTFDVVTGLGDGQLHKLIISRTVANVVTLTLDSVQAVETPTLAGDFVLDAIGHDSNTGIIEGYIANLKITDGSTKLIDMALDEDWEGPSTVAVNTGTLGDGTAVNITSADAELFTLYGDDWENDDKTIIIPIAGT